MGYTNTFIAVAEDCRARSGEVPLPKAGKATVASTQYAMLAGAPGRWTQEDVLFASSPAVRGHDDLGEEELKRMREEYFSTPRACLRASPLPKTLGWGLHYDADGRITLHAVGSPQYQRLSATPSSPSSGRCVPAALGPEPVPVRDPSTDQRTRKTDLLAHALLTGCWSSVTQSAWSSDSART